MIGCSGSGRTLSKRIKDILILGDLRSRVTRHDIMAPVDLQVVLDAAARDIEDKAEERKISLDVQLPQTTVLGSTKQLTILFSNLLSNAVAYSHEGGKIEVFARKHGDEVTISVVDHGIGMTEDALPNIFDEYFRTKEGTKFNKESTGLGLTIVRRIAQNLGLPIRVMSEEGVGTTFEVTIPVAKESLPRRRGSMKARI